MKHPETICEEIVPALTTDKFTLLIGKKPDQNFDADEAVYPVVFLDKPIKSDDDFHQTNYVEANIPIALFFAYTHELDDTEIGTKFTVSKTKAWNAAREFVLRLKKRDDIESVTSISRLDIDGTFDINLTGCILNCTLKIRDSDSSCLT